MKVIDSASLTKYNKNNRGSHIGDCSIRSTSLALDQPYHVTSKGLKDQVKDTPGIAFNSLPNITEYIRKFEPGAIVFKLSQHPKVYEFADDNPEGTYVLFVGHQEDDVHATHAVCLIDNIIYDTWDCLGLFVKQYVLVTKEPSDRNLYDMSSRDRDSLEKYAILQGKKIINKYIKKYGLKLSDIEFTGLTYENVIYMRGKLKDKRIYQQHPFKVRVSVPLGLHLADAKRYVKKKLKTKLYDKMTAIGEDIQDQVSSLESARYYDEADTRINVNNKKELKFFNGLPGWVKPLITNIDADNKYTLYFMPLKNDKDRSIVKLSGKYTRDIKTQLSIYKYGTESLGKYSRPSQDYNIQDYI